MAKLSEQKKTELLEAAVLEGNVEQVRNLCKEHGSFEFTARALGIACRFIGADMVKCLIEGGATFQYEASSAMVRKYKCTYAINSRSECNVAYAYECYLVGQSIGLDQEHAGMQVLSASERADIVRLLFEHRKEIAVDLPEMLYQGIMNCEWEAVAALKECGVNKLSATRMNRLASQRGATANEQRESWVFSRRLGAMNESNLLTALHELSAVMDGKRLFLSSDDVLEKHWGERDSLKAIWFTPGVFEAALASTTLVDRAQKMKWDALYALVEKSNTAGLTWAISEGWASKPADFKKLFEHSQKHKVSPDLTAVLLQHYTPQAATAKKGKSAMDALDLDADPFSAAEMKDKWSTKKQEDGTLIITSYKGTETDVVVPNRIGKTPVTAIDADAFNPSAPRLKNEQIAVRKAIRSVEFLEGIKELPPHLFAHHWQNAHDALEKVILPEGLEVIGENCFHGCAGLKEIVIPPTVKEIGSWAFHDCTGLKEITIPDSVKTIGDDAFSGCRKLTKVHLPEKMTKLPEFSVCGFKEFVVPPHIKKLSSFHYCTSLKRVVLHDGIKAIPHMCFSDTALESIDLPASVTSIGDMAFENCKKLRPFDIPETVTQIADNAFAGCTQFQNEQGLVVVRGVVHSYEGKNKSMLCLDPSIERISRQALEYLPDIVYRESEPRDYPLPDFSALKVGSTVAFGRFMQNPTLEMEPITWRVIAQEDDRKLLLAEKGLFAIHSEAAINESSWEKCPLRKRLCNDFMQVAFDQEEQSHIQPVTLSNPGSSKHRIPDSADTTEKVFLLSLEEVEQYLPDNKRNTSWTKLIDQQLQRFSHPNTRSYWLLRTRGGKKDFAQLCVKCLSGGTKILQQSYDLAVFRPAMWVK